MNEYTTMLSKLQGEVGKICAGDNNGKVKDILTGMVNIMHVMSDDIEELRRKSHGHDLY